MSGHFSAGLGCHPRYSGARAAISQYAAPDPVRIVAVELGLRRSTAKQYLKASDSRNPFVLAARITAALYRAGLIRRAESLCLHIDLARSITLPVLVNATAVRDALIAEAETEGKENVAQVAIETLSPGELDTWRRLALKEIAVTMHAVRLIDAYLASGKPC